MGEYKLKRAVLDSPINKVIAGPIIVAVRATFTDGKEDYDITCVSATTEDSIEAIEAAQKDALNKCRTRFEETFLDSKVLAVRDEFIKEAILQKYELEAVELIKVKEAEIKENFDDEELVAKHIKTLHGTGNERQQEELNRLFETLGMSPIVITDESNPISFALAQALINELKKMVKKFEVATDVTVLERKKK